MKRIQKAVFLIGILLLAANSYAGRWLSPDPIEQMERDPKPTMPGVSLGVSAMPSMIEINSKSLYTYVENNPLNEVDPLGLWNLWAPWTWGVSDGIGTSLGNSLNPFDASAGWSGFSLETSSEADAAFLDGIIPFWDPFSNLYDPCDKGLQWSKSIGGYTRDAEISLATWRVIGPYDTRGLPPYVGRIRQFIRYDRAHHGKPPGWDGTLFGGK
ncbi:MAG: hypothetical protein ACREC8_07465 [Limisphaerales bacterium]